MLWRSQEKPAWTSQPTSHLCSDDGLFGVQSDPHPICAGEGSQKISGQEEQLTLAASVRLWAHIGLATIQGPCALGICPEARLPLSCLHNLRLSLSLP